MRLKIGIMNKTGKSTIILILLSLAIAMGGCGERVFENVAYYDPNWMIDGRIMAVKSVYRYKHRGAVPGYSSMIDLFRGDYIVSMKDDGSDEKEIYGGEGKSIGIPVASPLGNYIAYRSGQHINIITASGTREVKGIDCGERLNSFDWSPDETKLAYSVFDRIEYYPNYSSGIKINSIYIVDINTDHKETYIERGEEVAWGNGRRLFYEYTSTPEADGYVRSYLHSKDTIEGTTIQYNGDSIYSAQVSKTDQDKVYGIGEGKYKCIHLLEDTYTINTLIESYVLPIAKLSFNNDKIVGADWESPRLFRGVWVMGIDGSNLTKLRD